MEAAGKTLKHSPMWLFAIVIYFFNSFVWESLPLAVILTPVWLYLIYLWKVPFKNLLFITILLTVIFALVHFSTGVIYSYYFISTAILYCLGCFAIVSYYAFKIYGNELDSIFRQLLILNFIATIISIVLLFIPSLKDLVWYTNIISEGIKPIPRLKLFTTEASHYSYFFAPIAMYFIARLLFFRTTKPFLTLLFVALPLILSFSLGVLLCLILTGIAILLIYCKKILATRKSRYTLFAVLLALALIAILLYIFFPDNPLYHRIHNLITNKDSSARGRTYESFIIAEKIISQKSYLFGAGPGQFKEIGRHVILSFYKYLQMPLVVRLPNACADTLVCYGYAGIVLRLSLQIGLFFKTKVFENPYRLWLFLFLFLYQFTGSYITNSIEYLLWALTFAPVFQDFKQSNRLIKNE